jgi:hypothetical protein
METGRLKVFDHLFAWFDEFNQYHRMENGKINPINDDIMSATRYAVQSRRFATVAHSTAYNSFDGKLDYPDLGVV